MGQELVIQNSNLAVQDTWMDASLIVHQVKEIQKLYKEIMKPGIHYGPAFPGSQKPSLLLPGVELLNLVFRIDIQVETTVTDMGKGHREYAVNATAYNIVNGQRLGSGVGSCSTMESQFRYRQAKLKCPDCGQESIIQGKENYGGGWICWKKQGGCGAKFELTDKKIMKQERGRVENPDIADQYNTVLKIAKKRSIADATKTVTGASAFFTQDAEDFVNAKFENVPEYQPESPKEETPKKETYEEEIKREREEEIKLEIKLEHARNLSPSNQILLKKCETIVQRIGTFKSMKNGNLVSIREQWEAKGDNADLHEWTEWLSKAKKDLNAAAVKADKKDAEKEEANAVPITKDAYNDMLDVFNSVYTKTDSAPRDYKAAYKDGNYAECHRLFEEAQYEMHSEKQQDEEPH